jgi:hypothetical protein
MIFHEFYARSLVGVLVVNALPTRSLPPLKNQIAPYDLLEVKMRVEVRSFSLFPLAQRTPAHYEPVWPLFTESLTDQCVRLCSSHPPRSRSAAASISTAFQFEVRMFDACCWQRQVTVSLISYVLVGKNRYFTDASPDTWPTTV